MNTSPQSNPKTLTGVVVSTKMKDTAVVLVERYTKHPKYKKFMQISKKYKVHDVGNTAHVGARVEIVETRPLSKDKHFKMAKIITAGTVLSVNETSL